MKFKLNTVVCQLNKDEDMSEFVRELQPARWKVFQVLQLAGENDGRDGAKRDVKPLLISDDEFAAFVERHSRAPDTVRPTAESNSIMRTSYFMLDEHMRYVRAVWFSKHSRIAIQAAVVMPKAVPP